MQRTLCICCVLGHGVTVQPVYEEGEMCGADCEEACVSECNGLCILVQTSATVRLCSQIERNGKCVCVFL